MMDKETFVRNESIRWNKKSDVTNHAKEGKRQTSRRNTLDSTEEVKEHFLPHSRHHIIIYPPDSGGGGGGGGAGVGNGSNGPGTIMRSSQSVIPLQNLHRNLSLANNSETGSIVALNTIQEVELDRRPSVLLHDILSTRRPSAIMATIRSPNQNPSRFLGSLHELSHSGSSKSLNQNQQNGGNNNRYCNQAQEFRKKNRRVGDDALSSALSALYAKILVVLGIAMPVTDVLTSQIPPNVYKGFYVYLYGVSIAFVIFVYVSHMRTRALFSLIKSYHEKTNTNYTIKKRTPHFGSFYLRVGAISFGIGTMVYSGLEFGQFFEMNENSGCRNILVALTPAARMALSIIQMQFIFLNTTELDMARHKVIARFGLMHMVATNLCEWLYVLVEETKHEIHHFSHSALIASTVRPFSSESSTNEMILIDSNSNNTMINASMLHGFNNKVAEEVGDCERSNIMGTLIQNASPFLFPCTIEYSLICAVILYEMWKKVKSLGDIERSRRAIQKQTPKSAHHFSVDCSRAHRGMFSGILVIVLTIICLIMYFVMYDKPEYQQTAIAEVTICEILLYSLTTLAVVAAVIKMRDLKFQQKTNDLHSNSITLDCTLLVLAQTGVYVYGMFSIMGSYFSITSDGGQEGLVAEILNLLQTSVQTLFILNASWRRCRGHEQQRLKPGRQIVTFLLVANMSLWFLYTLIKGRAGFRPTHLNLYGIWAWTVITHVSMPLAIFYRFHSTICLFEIWKSAYKARSDH